MLEESIKELIGYFLLLFERSSYPGVFFLMALESTLFPVPSEIIMPPAGYLASQGKLSLFGVILAGVFGSLVGALFNYYLALKLGRPALIRLVKRYGKYLLLTEQSFHKIERFWDDHGHISTFVGRLLPGMRHVISIPAGLARMAFVLFCLYTCLGALIWCGFLALCGYYFGKNEALLKGALSKGFYGILAVVFFIVVFYLYFKWPRPRPS